MKFYFQFIKLTLLIDTSSSLSLCSSILTDGWTGFLFLRFRRGAGGLPVACSVSFSLLTAIEGGLICRHEIKYVVTLWSITNKIYNYTSCGQKSTITDASLSLSSFILIDSGSISSFLICTHLSIFWFLTQVYFKILDVCLCFPFVFIFKSRRTQFQWRPLCESIAIHRARVCCQLYRITKSN